MGSVAGPSGRPGIGDLQSPEPRFASRPGHVPIRVGKLEKWSSKFAFCWNFGTWFSTGRAFGDGTCTSLSYFSTRNPTVHSDRRNSDGKWVQMMKSRAWKLGDGLELRKSAPLMLMGHVTALENPIARGLRVTLSHSGDFYVQYWQRNEQKTKFSWVWRREREGRISTLQRGRRDQVR